MQNFEAMTGLTTHILDLSQGRPAAGVRLALHRRGDASGDYAKIVEKTTNADGRCDAPLLTGVSMTRGAYRIDFYIGDYFRSLDVQLPEPLFLDVVPVNFGIADATAHYHVPLLISPYGYSTYRGS